MSDNNTPPQRKVGPHAPLPTPQVGLGAAGAVEGPRTNGMPTSREEDPRVRAARRAEELMQHVGDLDEGEDKFYINPAMIPDGWDYEWKRDTVYGKKDPSYEVQTARKGWEFVPADRHRPMMPEGWTGDFIERDGMVLMERPLIITQRARDIEYAKARGQVRAKEQQLTGAPAGDASPFDRTNKGSPLVKIGRSYEPMPIPKE